MSGQPEIRVVLKAVVLSGRDIHLVAVAYINKDEYRVYAPGAAEGHAFDWAQQLFVRQLHHGDEYQATPTEERKVLPAVIAKLEQAK